MLISAPTTPSQEVPSEGTKPVLPYELTEQGWELLSAKLRSPIESYGVVNMMRQKAMSNADSLYSNKDKWLLSLAKTPALAKQNGVIALQPGFKAEMLAESFEKKRYLDKTKRKKLLATVKDNKFFDSDNMSLWGEYIYGLLPDGRLYVDKASKGKNHSHIVAGLPVIATGHAYFSNGRLITLSNNSGHYKPMPSQMKKGIQWFFEKCGHDFIFEDHSSFKLSEVNKGLKYAKASAIVNSATAENVTESVTLSKLNSLFDEHFKMLNYLRDTFRAKEEVSDSDSDTSAYALVSYYTSTETECFYQTENGKEIIPCQLPSAEELEPQYQPFTSLQINAARFTGTKNLDRFKAKPGQ